MNPIGNETCVCEVHCVIRRPSVVLRSRTLGATEVLIVIVVIVIITIIVIVIVVVVVVFIVMLLVLLGRYCFRPVRATPVCEYRHTYMSP